MTVATIRVDVSPDILRWVRDLSFHGDRDLAAFPKFDAWVERRAKPTLNELTRLAKTAGVPFGYMFLQDPPAWELPIPDFRDGFAPGSTKPSPDLMAVLNQSLTRQDWYRDYAQRHGLPEVAVVGSARERDAAGTAADIRTALAFELSQRTGTWSDTRKYLLRAFERLGGLTIATSMVANNTKRPLNPAEFRGFALPDSLAPLVFVNTKQTLNGQIFTLVHEFAHIWRGKAGIGNEGPDRDGQYDIEKWCNQVASQVLVPEEELASHWASVRTLPIPDALDKLARVYRCGTLVVLQALRRYGLEAFSDFQLVYENEERRLKRLADKEKPSDGGDHYYNQPYRVGDRLSRAIIGDTVEGSTTYAEGMKLMSMRSAMNFDEYARRLGVSR
ncbi:ImmA/IrrE family metallo-endopeptidase [Arthrobacter frigidicola]|nr:ImmA/IrrE family metallo-endopeptidase [Arthrobacter frigidicola]